MTRWTAAGLLVATAAFAQPAPRPGISISLAPPFIEKLARANSSLTDAISLTNNSDVPVMVSVDFADFQVNATGEVEEQPSGSDPTSLAPYIRINPLKLRVPAQGRAFFRYSVQMPAEFKQLRTQIFFSSTPIVPNAPNQVLFVPRMGVPLYVENLKARPADLKVSQVRWSRTGDQLLMTMNVRNDGERNIRPRGTVEVRSADRKFTKTFAFNSGNEPVLPGQQHEWTQSFRPVFGGDLSIRMRFETSPRASFEQQYRVP